MEKAVEQIRRKRIVLIVGISSRAVGLRSSRNMQRTAEGQVSNG